MRINFRQGIISYPTSGSAQAFMVKSGAYVGLKASTGPIEVAFAYKDTDYLLTENADVPNAWGPFATGVNYWLYWDINLRTGVRTFGYTTVEPVESDQVYPGIPDQHWFDTVQNVHYVFTNGQYREVARVFACKLNTNTFYPLGVGFPSTPYAGSQIGDYTPNTAVGTIISDNTGSPIRRSNGAFFTTESDFFINGSVINPIRVDATIVTGTALETMAKFQVVKFSEFGKLNLAGYNDIQTTTIAMLLDDLVWEETGTVCVQGYVVNPAWNWSTVGVELWVSEGGVLTEHDPHVANGFVYPTSKAPVARVVTPTSIIFDQGLGGKGDRGEPGLAGGVSLATTTTYGTVRLSTSPVLLTDPIVVGNNDIRLSNKVAKAGDTMTGPLILHSDPVIDLGAATKQYVDSSIQLVDTSNRVAKSGDTMTGALILSGDPQVNMGAATKSYVDGAVNSVDLTSRVAKAGDTMTGPLVLSSDPITNLGAATKQYVDSKPIPYDLTLACTDTSADIAPTTTAVFAIVPRNFTPISIRADVLTASTAGDVTAAIKVNGTVVQTLTISQSSTSTTIPYTNVLVAGDALTVDITSTGTGARGLVITITGAV